MTLTEKVEELAHDALVQLSRKEMNLFSWRRGYAQLKLKAACREYSGILRGFCWGYLDGYFSTAIRHGITDIRSLQREKMQPLIDTWKRVLKGAKRKEDTP